MFFIINDEQLISFIEEKTSAIAKRLKLRSPTAEINRNYNNCSSYNEENRIVFGLVFLKECKNENFRKEIIPSDVFCNRVYFVIAHEVGHILQFTRHRGWFEKYYREHKTDIGVEVYAKQKLERNASKIASILLKEYKKEN